MHMLPLAGVRTAFDVGAGDGWLVRRLRDRGIHADGAEPYGTRAQELSATSAESLQLTSGSYDLITLWHVLEHLDEPQDVLVRAREGLRDGGRVVVAVPNLDSLQAGLGGDRWFHQDVPRHAAHFTREGLLRLVARSGLRTSKLRTFTLDQNLLGMTQTLLNRVVGHHNAAFAALKVERPAERSAIAASAVAFFPAAVVGTGLELAASLVGRGGSLVVEAMRA